MSVEQQLLQFVSRQIKVKADRIAKETASESAGVTARELVEHVAELDKAIESLFADESATPRRTRRAQS